MERPLLLTKMLRSVKSPASLEAPKRHLAVAKFTFLQEDGREMVRWLVEAKARSEALGPNCSWNWSQAGIIPFADVAFPLPMYQLPASDGHLEPNAMNQLILHPVESSQAQNDNRLRDGAGAAGTGIAGYEGIVEQMEDMEIDD